MASHTLNNPETERASSEVSQTVEAHDPLSELCELNLSKPTSQFEDFQLDSFRSLAKATLTLQPGEGIFNLLDQNQPANSTALAVSHRGHSFVIGSGHSILDKHSNLQGTQISVGAENEYVVLARDFENNPVILQAISIDPTLRGDEIWLKDGVRDGVIFRVLEPDRGDPKFMAAYEALLPDSLTAEKVLGELGPPPGPDINEVIRRTYNDLQGRYQDDLVSFATNLEGLELVSNSGTFKGRFIAVGSPDSVRECLDGEFHTQDNQYSPSSDDEYVEARRSFSEQSHTGDFLRPGYSGGGIVQLPEVAGDPLYVEGITVSGHADRGIAYGVAVEVFREQLDRIVNSLDGAELSSLPAFGPDDRVTPGGGWESPSR